MKLKKMMAALAAAGLASGALAAGQVEKASEAADKAEQDERAGKLVRVEVTGSSLKRINAETASPVQVIDAKQIENMGARTLLQVLDNLPAARPAQQDFRSMFTGSDGGSQANLRGLGAQGTLVLLNGRRLSFYGAPSGFQTMFVNIDSIPAAAIERMEVLTDGASAVYGSDAVAGVINVITKKNYQGLEARASADKSAEVSAYGERQASLIYGTGDLDKDGWNVYGSVNVYQRDRIALADTYDKRPGYFYVNNPNFVPNFRIGTGSEPGVPNPGTFFVFDPAKNNARTQRAVAGCPTAITEASGTRCVWNNLPYALDTGPTSDRATAYLAGRMKLGESVEGFAEAAYTRIKLRGENGPRSFNSGTTSNWFSRNTGTKLNTFTNPYLGPNNVYLRGKLDADMAARMGGAAGLNYILQDAVGHFGQTNRDDSYRALAGLRGNLSGGWDFETALAIAGSHSTLYQTTNINTRGFEQAFGPTTVDPVTGRAYIADNPAYRFGEVSEANAALLRAAFPTFDIQSWTKLITWDAKIEGTLAKLGEREIRAAFGTSLMRESFDTPGNADAANGLITQQGGSWFDGRRTISALFGEVIVPLTDTLELNAAARLDKYPNFSANLAPKLGVQWRARPEVMVRGTYSEGFRAPNLAESGSGGVFAQVGGIRDTVRCDETNAIARLLLKSVSATEVDLGKNLLNSNCSTTVGGLTPPNPELRPEQAKISTLGLVLQPARNVSISLDYWFVYRKNEIVRQDFNQLFTQLVEQHGPTLAGTDRAIRNELTDADRANMAAVATMCATPANAAACVGALPRYSVGNLGGLINSYTNRGRTLVDGFDIDARVRFPLGEWGKLNTGLATTIRKRETYNYEDGSGFSGNYVGFYDSPRLRATFNADWAWRDFVTSVFVNYSGGTKWAYGPYDTDNTPANCTAASVPLPAHQCDGTPSYTTVNLGFTWKPVKGLDVGLNIKNVLDKRPYYDPNGWEGYNHAQNLFGRQFAFSVGYKFW
ncbi:TonB-dependent receptor plug domain-containing protein [Pseudoduganella buxea]|uniref:TonB-dependent receptor n=1 Tax=Pseudoduganella buxea TaxID=1949069 RepID=A0A6I3T3A6_9BURK|nr:TonB-dependent receptor [Pseudoduganella buxea]MTV56108.1 TonB-dependent receptor [Pseudoduganella buxea]GGC00494.1 TonB-dependent receptor [Pseudoduganella buxea]